MGNVKSNVILRPSTISLHKSSLGKGNNVYSIQSKANVIFNISVFIVFTNNIHYAAFTTIFLSLMDDLEWKNRSSLTAQALPLLCVWRHTSSLEGLVVGCCSVWCSADAGTSHWPWTPCWWQSAWHRTLGCAPHWSDTEPSRARRGKNIYLNIIKDRISRKKISPLNITDN